jgi:DNA mismatch repair protein MutS
MGSRLLQHWLGQPLVEVSAINARLDRVQAFVTEAARRGDVRDLLRELPDIERIVGRIVAGMALPRDLAGLRRGLENYPKLLEAARGDYG